MKRAIVFSKRCFIEILRDPASYIFSLGLPCAMLLLMTAINNGIPEEAGMTLYEIENLTPGIAAFSFSFTMLFASLIVSRDKNTALTSRLCASPMRKLDFIIGYTVPFMVIAVLQCIITFAAGALIGAVEGYYFGFPKVLLCIVCSLPCALVFVSIGIIFGSVFSEKAAPSASSVIITASGLLGGIWMDVNLFGGAFLRIVKFLPFYHLVEAMRSALNSPSETVKPIIITVLFALALFAVSVIVFRKTSSVKSKQA